MSARAESSRHLLASDLFLNGPMPIYSKKKDELKMSSVELLRRSRMRATSTASVWCSVIRAYLSLGRRLRTHGQPWYAWQWLAHERLAKTHLTAGRI